MGSEQIAQLQPSITEVFEAASSGDWCATFTVVEHPNDWLQVTRSELNFAYPALSDPTPAVEALAKSSGLDLRLSCWEGGKFVTLEYDANLGPSDVAKIADLVFFTFFNRATYDVEVEMLQLD